MESAYLQTPMDLRRFVFHDPQKMEPLFEKRGSIGVSSN